MPCKTLELQKPEIFDIGPPKLQLMIGVVNTLLKDIPIKFELDSMSGPRHAL